MLNRPVSAGRFNTKIDIEAPPTAQDSRYGTLTGDWTTVCSRIWARVEDERPSRSEAVRQGIAIASRRVTVQIRYRAGITAAMRVRVYRNGVQELFQIIGGPSPVMGSRNVLELFCETYSTQGNPA